MDLLGLAVSLTVANYNSTSEASRSLDSCIHALARNPQNQNLFGGRHNMFTASVPGVNGLPPVDAQRAHGQCKFDGQRQTGRPSDCVHRPVGASCYSRALTQRL